MENLKYCGHLIKVIKRSLKLRFKQFLFFDSTANNAILSSVTHSLFKIKWVPKEKKDYVKELFLIKMRKLKENENDKRESNMQNEKKNDSYFMFQDDSPDSSISEPRRFGCSSISTR